MIIHLLNRRRFRTVKWAATTFLLKAARESRGKKKLKHLLILTCRALAIAALIFAVARPLIGGFLGSGSGAVGTVVLVLDRSASMETKPGSGEPSYRESVLEQISQAVEKMGSPRLILIDSATSEIQEIPSPDVIPELSATYATDTQADIPTLVMKAIDYLDETKPGESEIWVASDLQRNDWRPSDSRWGAVETSIKSLPTKTKLRILTTGNKPVENFSLQLVSSRRIEDNLFLDIKLSRTEDDGSTTVPITYALNGVRSSERVTLKGQELRFQKRIPLTKDDDEGFGWIGIPSDNNPRDNSAYFAFGGKEPVNAWVVSEDPSGATANFLQKAAAPTGFARYNCQILTPTQTSQIEWDTASLIIWQAPLPTGAAATSLQKFVTSGGSALFLPSTEISSETIFGTTWGSIEIAPDGEYFINGSWVKDDGPWRNGMDGGLMPIEQIRSVKRRAIQGEGYALAEWDDNSALLYRQFEGEGSAVFLGTLPDDRWSNLEFLALHLVTIQRLLEQGTDRLHSGYRAIAGHNKAKTKSDEVRERLDQYEEFEPSLESYRAGVYRLGKRIVAVNRPSNENSTNRLDKEALDDILKGTSYSLFTNDNNKGKLVSEAWRAFLVAAMLFLVAEALLCLQPKPSGPPVKIASQTASTTPINSAS